MWEKGCMPKCRIPGSKPCSKGGRGENWTWVVLISHDLVTELKGTEYHLSHTDEMISLTQTTSFQPAENSEKCWSWADPVQISCMCFDLLSKTGKRPTNKQTSPLLPPYYLRGPIYSCDWSRLLYHFCAMLYRIPGEKTQRFKQQWVFYPCPLFGFMTMPKLHFGCFSSRLWR